MQPEEDDDEEVLEQEETERDLEGSGLSWPSRESLSSERWRSSSESTERGVSRLIPGSRSSEVSLRSREGMGSTSRRRERARVTARL